MIGRCGSFLCMIGRCGSYPAYPVMVPFEGPIHRLSQKPPLEVDSFDLSSATDRWPVPVIHDVIACLFGPASCIVNGSLALCVGPPLVGKFRTICTFSTGQPLGYYGSWVQPITSLSLYGVAWLAAWLVDRGRTSPLTDYALLGDDILIAHKWLKSLVSFLR